MTVAELIEKLQQFPPSLRVVTPGFDESFLDDLRTVGPVQVDFHDEQPSGHCGPHRQAPDGGGLPAVLVNF